MAAAKSTDVDESATSLPQTPEKPSPIKKLIDFVMNSRAMRSMNRYNAAKGAMLAGGIAYSALFSIVSALTIAWTFFMATLGNDADLRRQVIRAVNQVLPNILKDGSGAGLIDPDSLIMDSALNPTSIIAAVVLLWSAVNIMTCIRTCVQAMFGIATPAENIALQKARDLFGFIGMSFGIVLSALLGTAAGTMGKTFAALIGLDGVPLIATAARLGGLLVASAVAACTFACLFIVTAHVHATRKDLWMGSIIGGVVVQIVVTLGTSLVSSVGKNPLLASAASIATLLLFVNLLARVLLMVAAFTANPPNPVLPETPEEVHYHEHPNHVTLSVPRTLDWRYQKATGQIDVDPDLSPGVNLRGEAATGTARMPYDSRPDGTAIPAEPMSAEKRASLVSRVIKLEERVVAQRARLGQRPRIEIAEKDYWGRRLIIEKRCDGDRDAASAQTYRSVSSEGSQS